MSSVLRLNSLVKRFIISWKIESFSDSVECITKKRASSKVLKFRSPDRYDGIYLLNTFKWSAQQRTASGKHWSKLFVDISWPIHSQDFNTNSSIWHAFLSLLVLIIISFTCGWYLSLFSFNTRSLGNNILILWDENTYWSHMGNSRTNRKGICGPYCSLT